MMVPGLDSFNASAGSTTATGSPPSFSPDNDFDDAFRNTKRTPKACDRCRHKKTKCTGDSPCQRCRLDNTVCSFTNRRPKEGPTFNPQVAQKDAAMSMLYKCIEVMNRQILAARLGPYAENSLASYAENEEFIIGIILDRFGISPVLDEFDNQPVYLPGQRGFNPENCAIDFPHYSSQRNAYDNEGFPQGARMFFDHHQTAMQQGLYTSRSDNTQDVHLSEQGENSNIDRAGNFVPAPQRHHTYTYGQQRSDHAPIWTHESKLVDEPLLIENLYPVPMDTINVYIPGDNNPINSSAYEQQQAQIDRIRREQLLQRNAQTGAPINIPLPPHIAEMEQVSATTTTTTQWEFPSAVATAGVGSYPSAICSARASPESRLGRKSPNNNRGQEQTMNYTSYGGMSTSMRW